MHDSFFEKPNGLMFKLFDLAVLGVGTVDKFRLKVFKDKIAAVLRTAVKDKASPLAIIAEFEQMARYVLSPEKAIYFISETRKLVFEATGVDHEETL